MLFLLDALTLHELIDLAEREGIIQEAPACQECNTVGLRVTGDPRAIRIKIPQAMTLLREMLRAHYGGTLIIRAPDNLIV